MEPTEETEEVQLSKFMHMSREDLIKELNKAENKAKTYLKPGTVKRNIKKIIREYRALEDEKEIKTEESTHAEEVKQGADIQLHEPELPAVNEENYNEIRVQGAREYTEQATNEPALGNQMQTGLQQEKDHAAVHVEMKTNISHVSSDNLTYEDHDTEGQKGKKGLKKLIKKYKMLDQSKDAEPPTTVDSMTGNGTGQQKKSIQKTRPPKQIFKKDILEGRGEYFETITEPKETSAPVENQTIENNSIEGVMKTEDTNKGFSGIYNDTTVSYVSLQDSDSGIIANKSPSQTSRRKKTSKKVSKEMKQDSNVTEINVPEEHGNIQLSGNQTPMPMNKRKPAIKKDKEKFKTSDDTEHTSLPANLVRNADDIDKLNAGYMYEQDISADDKMSMKNQIHMQEGDTVYGKTEPEEGATYVSQLPERSTEESDTPTKETTTDAVNLKEIPYAVSVGPVGLSLPQSPASVDEKTQISEPGEDTKLSKQKSAASAASQNAGTVQPVLKDQHTTESDERLESENVAKGKLGEDIQL